MQIPITSDSLIVVNKHPGMGSALSPEDVVQHGFPDGTGSDGACGGESHLVQVFDLVDMDWRAKAILGCLCDRAIDKPCFPSSQLEALPELLDYNIDIERILAVPDFLHQGRPKGKVLKFERPPHNESSTLSPFIHCFGFNRNSCEGDRVPTS